MLDHQQALICTMMLMSAADGEMSDRELQMISQEMADLPVFRDFDAARLPEVSDDFMRMISAEDGLDRALDMIFASLPENLRETAYALAVEIAAVDGKTTQEELRLLEMIRTRFGVERLVAAAIERGARARFRTA